MAWNIQNQMFINTTAEYENYESKTKNVLLIKIAAIYNHLYQN